MVDRVMKRIEDIRAFLNEAEDVAFQDQKKSLKNAEYALSLLIQLEKECCGIQDDCYCKDLVDLKATVFLTLQRFYFMNSKFELSYSYGLQTLEIIDNEALDDKAGKYSVAYRYLSYVADLVGDHEKGIQYAKKSCDYAFESRDELSIPRSLVALAINYANAGDIESELELFQKALYYYEKSDNEYSTAVAKNNLAASYLKLNDIEKSKAFVNEALEIEERLGVSYRYPTYLNTAGDIEFTAENYEAAKAFYEKSVELLENFSNMKSRSYAFCRLGLIDWIEGNYETAMESFENALETSKTYNLVRYELTLHKMMSEAFEKTGHFELAYKHLKIYMKLQDESLNEKSKWRVLVDKIDYEIELAKQEAEVSKLKSDMLEEQVAKQLEELLLTQDVTIQTIAALAETRDTETGNHISRTMMYVKTLASLLKNDDFFKDQISNEMTELLHKSAQLHDIGKVGVPDAILLKPGKLTDEEFEEMKKHTIFAMNALQIAENALGDNSFMRYAREIAATHHEKWDGSGYPTGLSGEDIPLSGRIMAFADVYDALISERPYKRAFTHEEAIEIIKKDLGTHFDPRIGRVFLDNHDKFERIAQELNDTVDHYMTFEGRLPI